jgi:multiple sugar transport system ATP-binding protein
MPGKMTQSELQRVAVARTLITNPSVLLLDEPLSNLDAAFRVKMRAELKRLQREIAQTVIYVTHDQIEAMAMSDKIAVMNYGVLHQYGTPYEIYNYPKTRFVAGFIGTPPMNFLDGTFSETDEGWLDIGVSRINISRYVKLLKEGCSGSEITLGVRPEDVKIFHKRMKGSIEVQVEAYEPMGEEAIIDVRLGQSLVRVIAPITFQSKPGEKKFIEFNMDKIHLIDGKTEKVIL